SCCAAGSRKRSTDRRTWTTRSATCSRRWDNRNACGLLVVLVLLVVQAPRLLLGKTQAGRLHHKGHKQITTAPPPAPADPSPPRGSSLAPSANCSAGCAALA